MARKHEKRRYAGKMNEYAEKIAELIAEMRKQRAYVLVALDGRCAAGKTTLAEAVRKLLNCTVVHMDDFFLRPCQRTAERLAEPGGNMDRERFLEEVLLAAGRGEGFSYRPYDCKSGQLLTPVEEPHRAVFLAEGAYACHPMLQAYYDLRIFLDVSGEEQWRRLLQREGAERAELFRTRWIPLEERYLETYKIDRMCELYFRPEFL